MKTIISVIFISFFISSLTHAQNKVWEEDFDFEALTDQADGGSVSVDITNVGDDIQDCISKAKSQALFTIIFKGYPASNNATSSAALSDMSNYNQNMDFFINYLSSNTAGLAHIQKAKTNTSKPASKEGKGKKAKTRSTTTVYIMKTKLKEDLENLGYIESAASIAESMGITPKIMLVPSNPWMRRSGFVEKINSSMGELNNYRYDRALDDESMKVFKQIENHLKQPLQKNGFQIANLQEQVKQIAQENARASMRETSIEQSPLDLLAKQAGADIWLHVDLQTEGNIEKTYTITLNGVDPLTMTDVINGTPQIVKSSAGNEAELIRTTINAAIDNLMPEILNYFSDRDKKGLPVMVTFLKGEDAEFDFGSTVKIKGRPMPMAKVLDGVVNKVAEKSSPQGAATKTRREYEAIIPTKVEDFISGKVVANNAETFAYDVSAALSDFGIESGVEVEVVGLGKVFVIFNEDF